MCLIAMAVVAVVLRLIMWLAREAMKHRKLRIAWSVLCGIVAVFVVAIWMRSYRWHDTLILNEPSRASGAGWNKGELFFVTNTPPVTLRKELVFQHEEPDYEHNWEDTRLGFQF